MERIQLRALPFWVSNKRIEGQSGTHLPNPDEGSPRTLLFQVDFRLGNALDPVYPRFKSATF